jgi:hypothetical protein
MAENYTLRIDQGADFAFAITWRDPAGDPVDLTGFSAAMQIRKAYDSPDAMVSLTDGAGITLGGALGTIELAIAAADTQDLETGVWDLELTAGGGEVTRLLQGKAVVSPQVTR